MCCLFGLLDVKHRLSPSEKSRILSILGVYCEARGVDATGFCYTHKGKLVIVKKPIPAHEMAFRIPADAHVIMGHTRMTTQGSAAKQENNHPFLGQLPNTQFALAHNGVLSNDTALHKSEKLPKTAIETDSYVAVQLLEKQKSLTKCVKSARKLVLNGYAFPKCPVAEEMKESWMGWRGYAMRFLRTHCERDLEAFTPSDVLYEEYRRQCATHSYPCGEQTGFILLAKEMYPPIGNCRKMENGEQHRGLPGVRFLGIS